MAKIEINSVYSAQPSISKPNPFLSRAINYIFDKRLVTENPESLSVADHGCGKLRHLKVLCEYFNTIYLIDVEFQLNRIQKLFGFQTNIKEYISTIKIPRMRVVMLSNLDFDSSDLNLDIVFNLCVFDVEIPKTRKAMTSSAYKNLKNNGLFIVVIPRNDHSILVRCTNKNEYLDGHVFHHHGIATFYKNYRDTKPLVRRVKRQGFGLEADLSVYRQVCLIFRKRG